MGPVAKPRPLERVLPPVPCSNWAQADGRELGCLVMLWLTRGLLVPRCGLWQVPVRQFLEEGIFCSGGDSDQPLPSVRSDSHSQDVCSRHQSVRKEMPEEKARGPLCHLWGWPEGQRSLVGVGWMLGV